MVEMILESDLKATIYSRRLTGLQKGEGMGTCLSQPGAGLVVSQADRIIEEYYSAQALTTPWGCLSVSPKVAKQDRPIPRETSHSG